MTINTNLSRVQYTANGATTAFPFGSRVLLNTDLQVLVDGVTKVLTTDYTVAGVGGASATINFLVAPANLAIVTIARNVPLTQLADYVPNDPFPAETHEGALDKLTMLIQQLNEVDTRTLKFPISFPTSLIPTLSQLPAVGALLGWGDVNGTLKNYTIADLNLSIPTLISGLATGDFLRYYSGAWQNKTGASIIADLALCTDVELAAALTAYYTSVQVDAAIATALGTNLVPRKVADFMREGLYGRLANSFRFRAVPEVAPSVGTFTRSTIGYRTAINGLLESIAINTARHDYDFATGKYKGILMEPGRTNLWLQNCTLDNASVGKTNVTITANSTNAPDNAATADSIIETAVNAQHYIGEGFTITSGDQVAISAYVKPSTRDKCVILLDASSPFASASFDLATGAVNIAYASSGTAVTCLSAKITPCYNGFYRVEAVFQTTGVTTVNAYLRMLDASLNLTYLGNGGISMYGCGVQLEVGYCATSMIVTTTIAVARGVDAWSQALSGIKFNTAEGTLVFLGDMISWPNSGQGIGFLDLDDASTNNLITMFSDSSGQVVFQSFASASPQVGFTLQNATAINTEHSFIGTYKLNDYSGISDQGAVGTDIVATVPTGLTTLRIGALNGIYPLCGHVREVTYIPKKLANAEITELAKWLPVA